MWGPPTALFQHLFPSEILLTYTNGSCSTHALGEGLGDGLGAGLGLLCSAARLARACLALVVEPDALAVADAGALVLSVAGFSPMCVCLYLVDSAAPTVPSFQHRRHRRARPPVVGAREHPQRLPAGAQPRRSGRMRPAANGCGRCGGRGQQPLPPPRHPPPAPAMQPQQPPPHQLRRPPARTLRSIRVEEGDACWGQGGGSLQSGG